MKKQIKKGFTLVELLVVIAILAILATVSVVGYTAFIKKTNESVAMQELTQIRDMFIAEDINNDTFSITTSGTEPAGLVFVDGVTGDDQAAKFTTFITSNEELKEYNDTTKDAPKLTLEGQYVVYFKGGDAKAYWDTKTGEVKAGAKN